MAVEPTLRPIVEIYTMATTIVAAAPAAVPRIMIPQNHDSPIPLHLLPRPMTPLTLSPNLSSKDKLYFTFKEKINDPKCKRAHYLNIMYNELKRRGAAVPHQTRDHFHPLHVLSPRWWNHTHYYIYHYKDVETLVRLIIDMEAFPF